MNKKVTIFDVSRLSGVSKGTVDRVLHNRGEVSAETAEKVQKAIKKLKYTPNAVASVLASRNPRVIASLLPESSNGDYWNKWHEGMVHAVEKQSLLNFTLKSVVYDQYNAESFNEACDRLLSLNPSAVVLSGLFKDRTLSLTSQLRSLNIPYVFVDTKPEEDGYLAYFGMPMYDSGRLCAALLTERLEKSCVKRVLVVRILRDAKGESDPTYGRRCGFMDYLKTEFPDCEIDTVFISPSSATEVDRTLSEYFSKHSDVKLVATFNSRVHLMRNYLSAHPDKARRIVAFDDLPGNLEMLHEGQVSVLVCQRIASMSNDAATSITDFLMQCKSPNKRDNNAHMDILTRFNCENYE